ncbi:PREDICTED: crocetin glucosyltransferase, chloroplastic-like isoform X2 [Ipomoea nil]|uniref:crocetin glucosyltransferase, chloroplastic-like isoform X2 n=1 Tax=Ipomoea nil TaxID=35883 RepID=UPI000901D986|nr:PREDICTED: crocetin glucosyltransferase, chloroplastic-like isoform X2 [Ipomoea nil]
MEMKDCNVLLVMYPAQGQINPCLQFAKRLVELGVKLTFLTSLSVVNRMPEPPSIHGVDFATFSDGWDAGFKGSDEEYLQFNASLRAKGSKAIEDLLTAKLQQGSPISRVIYTTFMPWVGILAGKLRVPSTVLWIQPAAIFDIFYHFFTGGYEESFRGLTGNDNGVVELPGLSTTLSAREIPSFLLPAGSSATDSFIAQAMKDHIELLSKEERPKVLVNTFDALEFDALRVIEKVGLVGIGPFVPSAYLDGEDPCDTSFGGDMRKKCNGYVEWLDSKPKGSVIYVTMEGIARGLVETRRPFLWVIREGGNGEKPEEKLSCKADLEKQGKIVRWGNQVEVLQHSSVGCFVSHCGWNSTLEALTSGVPIVGCPLWTDQWCNSKFIQDVWKTGIRVKVNEKGIVEANEVKTAIECIMGEKETAQGLRNNAAKFKALAKEAMREDGSSYVNLKAYVDEVLLGHGQE